MNEEDEKERGFKVQDRRRFSAEGDTKADADVEAATPPPTEEPVPDISATDKPATDEAAADKPETTIRAEPGSHPHDHADAGAFETTSHQQSSRRGPHELEITFATFLVGLSSEALGALGELPDPATGEARRDLQAAQQLIDIIGMLRDKTRGNLDATEQSLIDAVLFDLRMKYVELARQSAR